MLKEFVDRLLELSNIRTFDYNGFTYAKVDGNRIGRVLLPGQVLPETLQLNNLAGLLDYVDQLEFYLAGLFFAIMNPYEVVLMGQIDPQNDNRQFEFAKATLSVKGFEFGHWFDLETFIISLLAQFGPSGDRDATVEMLANLANEHIIQNTDDKFSQSLQVKTGLTTKAQNSVKNPVILRPFRTFREIVQPESEFVLRYRNKGGMIEAALFEGDGGCWELEAIQRIKDWLITKTEISVIG